MTHKAEFWKNLWRPSACYSYISARGLTQTEALVSCKTSEEAYQSFTLLGPCSRKDSTVITHLCYLDCLSKRDKSKAVFSV